MADRQDDEHRHTQRMPAALWKKARAKARARGLTMNGYINVLVREDVQAPGRQHETDKEIA